jgi:hypothetical protein
MKCNTLTSRCIQPLMVILILMYIVLFYILDNFPAKWQKKIDDLQYKCLLRCNSCDLSGYRDSGYYLLDKGPDVKTCLFTVFELSHVIFHMFLGYYYNVYVSLGLSVGFEIYEHYVFDCGSYLDIMHNMGGFLIGYSLR